MLLIYTLFSFLFTPIILFFIICWVVFCRHIGFYICCINQCGFFVFSRITTWRRQWKWEIFLRNFEGIMVFDLQLFLVLESMFSPEGWSLFSCQHGFGFVALLISLNNYVMDIYMQCLIFSLVYVKSRN